MRFLISRSVRLVLCGCILLLSACDDKSPTGPGLGASYPTRIAPLYPDSLLSAKEAFASANPRICSSLNKYGFTSGDLCSDGSKGVGPDPDYEALTQIARDTILRNRRFTGVSDNCDLPVTAFFGSSSDIRVQFRPQSYQGLWVRGTTITARVDSIGVIAICGNHYPTIYVPPPVISAQRAKSLIIGMPLRWSDEEGQHLHYVEYDDIFEEPTRVILEVIGDTGIELPVAWRISVERVPRPRWVVYIDSVRGDSLDVFGPIG